MTGIKGQREMRRFQREEETASVVLMISYITPIMLKMARWDALRRDFV